MRKPVLTQPMTFEAVQHALQETHASIPERLWYPEERVALYQESQWYLAQVPRELIECLVWGDYHYHDSGRTDLVTPTSSMAEAAEAYPALDPGKSEANKECYSTVEGMREFQRNGGVLPPLFLIWHQKENRMEHIDGFHRMLAWVLDSEADAMTAIVAVYG